jgi:4-hydroxythreonine-4-phosphate dehydrogenase
MNQTKIARTDKPIIGITMGDPAGIGPETAVKVLMEKTVYDLCNPLIVGDAKVLDQVGRMLRQSYPINRIKSIHQAKFDHGTLDVFHLDLVDVETLKLGQVSIEAGNAAFKCVEKVIELAMRKEIDATVTGPLQKESINAAGYHYSGHTEIFAHLTNTKKYAMLLVEQFLKVIHVSTHVSMRQACDLVKTDRIVEVIQLMDDGLRRLGIANPRIGVAGLNPHASDGGLFGVEEKKEIAPAVEFARKSGLNVEGPIPADTLFSKARGGFYDGCVAMYHDQGHIPFKLQGFVWDNAKNTMSSVRGVNITLGLPIIRTSVDHGTAFDIAGKGIASPESLFLAIEYAAKMVRNKKAN